MKEPTYTWKTEYILPYESYWSIRAKFCYLNAEKYSNFSKINRDKKIIKTPSVFECIPKSLKPFYIQRTFERKVYICPICIINGYHSIFHQWNIFKNCFIHLKTTLIKTDYEFQYPKYDSGRQDFYEQQSNVTVETIVQNHNIRKKILKAVKPLSEVNSKYSVFDFTDGISSCNGYYDSVKKFILKNIFQISVESSKKCILAIKKENILDETSKLLYLTYCEVWNYFFLYNKNHEMVTSNTLDEYTSKSLCYVENKALYTTYPTVDATALCMKNIVYKFIDHKCGNLDMFYDYCSELWRNPSSRQLRTYSHKEIYAGILSIYAMTGINDPAYFLELWDKWKTREFYCQFSLNILSDLHKVTNWYHTYENSGLLVLKSYILSFTILQDLFYTLNQYILYKIDAGEIDLMDENILHRNHKIKAPQYIIEEDEKHIVKIYRFIPEDTET